MTKRQQARKIASKFNSRLRRLEASGYSQASDFYRYYQKLAFDEKTSYLSTDYKGRFKFRTDVSQMSDKSIEKLIDLERSYQEAISSNDPTKRHDTSTVTGVKRKHERQYEKIKALIPELSKTDYANMWNNEAFKAAVKKYSYSSTIEMINDAQAQGFDVDTAADLINSSTSIFDAYTRFDPDYLKNKYNYDGNDYEV